MRKKYNSYGGYSTFFSKKSAISHGLKKYGAGRFKVSFDNDKYWVRPKLFYSAKWSYYGSKNSLI